MNTNEAIQVCNLVKRFDGRSILSDVTFSVRRGSITSFIGKSGAGKSLVLKHIMCLMKPDSGAILINGVDVTRADRKKLAEIRSRMGFLFQGSALFDGMTVYDNIALPLRERENVREREISPRVLEQARLLGLEKSLNNHPPELSGGMKKRVGLARALITRPDIVLFDEPTTGLDPLRKHDVHSLIMQSQRVFGFTALVVSHDIPDVFDISDSVVMIDQGRIAMAGSPAHFLRSTIPAVANFLEGTDADRCSSTGLLVRSEFEKRLREEYSRSRRHGTSFCLLMIRTGGSNGNVHSGNGANRAAQAAEVLRECVRGSDLLARYDETTFVLLLPHTSLVGAEIIGRRLENILDGRMNNQRDGYPSIRFGMSEYDGEKSWEDMVRQALSTMSNPVYDLTPGNKTERASASLS